MARARKKAQAAQPEAETAATAGEGAPPPAADLPVDTTPLPADEPPAEQVHAADVVPASPPQADVNPFPRVIHTANFNGYKVRLMQDQKENEMQIRFGEGERQDRPSDAVLDLIRSHLVPDEFKTQREREEGKPVRWFNFSTEKGCWCAWMRNQPHITRTKAEQVFNGVVAMIAQEIGSRPQERSEGVPF